MKIKNIAISGVYLLLGRYLLVSNEKKKEEKIIQQILKEKYDFPFNQKVSKELVEIGINSNDIIKLKQSILNIKDNTKLAIY